MPERWQDELKKLRREEMPDGVRDRAERGPQRELPHDGRQRLIAGVVAFAVFIAAGAFAWRAFDHDPSTPGAVPSHVPSPSVGPAELQLASNDGNPTATLSYGATSQKGTREGYEWCGQGQTCVSGISDFTAYPPVSEFLPMDAAAVLSVTGDARSIDVAVSDPSGDRIAGATAGDGEPVAAEPGRYVWNVSVTWDDGSANYYFGIEVIPPPSETPDVLHLTCTPDSATLDSGIVRARADGVHIAVDASDDVRGGDIVAGSMPEDFVGVGLDAQDDGSRGIPIQPGRWSVGCYAGARGGVDISNVGTPRVASFTVIDPGGFYAADTLSCDATTGTTIDVTGSVASAQQDWKSMIPDSAAAIPGLLPTDTVRDAGYLEGSGSKDGPHPVVVRDGTVIAMIRFGELAAAGGSWTFTLESCRGSALGDEAAEPTASPAPDVAVVRCTGDGTELDTPTVQVQPDGLHIDATNLANADGIDVEPASGANMGSDAFDGGDHSETVLPVPPGEALIGCLFTHGDHVVQLGSDDHPDWYVPVQILDPGGTYVPSELSCGTGGRVSVQLEVDGIVEQLTEPLIREWLPGILLSDTVELAGYPGSDSRVRVWRIVRDGAVLAFISDPAIAGYACAGSGIGGA